MKKYKLLLATILAIICAFAFALGLAACGSSGSASITSIEKTNSSGLVDTYTITYSDGTEETFTITNGENGTKGDDGADGAVWHTASGSPSADTGVDGDMYLDTSTYEIYQKVSGEWTSLGNIKGAQGIEGKQGEEGKQGDEGDSAYQLYCDTYGYTGTLEEWLEALANGELSNISYTVTFDSDGGSAVASQDVTRGDKVTKPEDPTFEGHTFVGWYLGEEAWSFIGYSVTESITLKAKWAITNAEVVYTINTETMEYEVTSYKGTDENVELAATLDGMPVTSIAEGAFRGNTSVKSVTISSNITTIGANAFNNSTSLESIVIPESVTTIGATAFADASNLASVYYAGTITQWANITFGSGSANPMFNGADLYLEGDTTAAVTTISLEGITAINSSAFYGCTSITSITIPETVTSIGGYAFKECVNLATVTFSGTSQLTEIGTEAFYNCSSLTGISLPDGVKTIDSYSFYGSGINSITIPVSLTTIGGSSFYSCGSLTNVYYAGTADQWVSISFGSGSASPLYNGANLYLEGNTETAPSTITLKNVTAINSSAFYGCISITSIEIPESVETIGNYAFMRCVNLASITFSGDSDLTSIGTQSFNACYSLTSITIPANVESIGTNAFNGCYNLVEVYNLSSLTITAGATDNGYVAYYAKVVNDSTTTSSVIITMDEAYQFYIDSSSGSDVYYLIGYTGSETDITLPTITDSLGKTYSYEIYEYAFYYNSTITSVVIPGSVTAIGDYAFAYCTALTSVTIESGVTTVGNYAFAYCTAITEINYNANVSGITIGNYIFRNAGQSGNGITLTIGADVTSIPDYAFYSATDKTFPYITSIVFDDNIKLESIGIYAFAYLPITSITIPEGVSSIGNYAFYSCTNLESVTMLSGLTSVGNRAFNTCSSLESVTIPATVTSFGEYAFSNDSNIKNVYYGGTASQWASISFSYSTANPLYYKGSLYLNGNTETAATDIEITGVTEIKAYAFCNCTGLLSVKITNTEDVSCTAIGYMSFYNCTNLASITIPATVTSFGEYAFSNDSNIKNVYYGGTASQWANISFSTYSANPFAVSKGELYLNGDTTTSATQITITGITEIKQYTFYNYTTLVSVEIDSSVTTIGANAFYNCSNLTTVYYKGDSTSYAAITVGDNNTKLTSATVFYYSATQPTDTTYTYYYYDTDGTTIKIWEATSSGTESTTT